MNDVFIEKDTQVNIPSPENKSFSGHDMRG
jgi:hypothetical protein